MKKVKPYGAEAMVPVTAEMAASDITCIVSNKTDEKGTVKLLDGGIDGAFSLVPSVLFGNSFDLKSLA